VVQISAHCDHSDDAKPITCEAYSAALASGAEYAEFDIRKTADNVLVVYHDARAGRGGPLVRQLGHQELCDRLGYQVPRVDEVMGLIAGRLLGHLDLKETGYEAEVVGLASSILGPENFVATTLEDVSVAAIKRAFPEVRTALSLGRSRPSGTANCTRCAGSRPAARTGWRPTTGWPGWAWPGPATSRASASWCGRWTPTR